MSSKPKYIIMPGSERQKFKVKQKPVEHASSRAARRVLDVDEVFAFQPFEYNDSILDAEYDLPYPRGLPPGSYLNMWPLFGLSHAPAEQERLKGYKKALQILSRTGP